VLFGFMTKLREQLCRLSTRMRDPRGAASERLINAVLPHARRG